MGFREIFNFGKNKVPKEKKFGKTDLRAGEESEEEYDKAEPAEMTVRLTFYFR